MQATTQKLNQTGLRWLWAALVVIGLDRITKVIIQQHLVPYDELPVTSFFNLTLAFNKGAAFSFLNSAGGWQTWFFGILAVIICTVLLVWLRRLSANKVWLALGLCFIIGGALGNLWDRISYGHVIDFLDFHLRYWHWPVFNVADSFICIGVVMLLIDAILKK